MYHFCTYFDRNYALRGLTMYRSLATSGCEFVLYALTLDEETYRCVSALNQDNLKAVKLGDLEAACPSLLDARANRSLIEYYFTLTPFLPLYLLDQNHAIDLITYVDADLYFYASPAPIFDELGDHSILICEHRYSLQLEKNLKYGMYNVQFQTFRRDAAGLACLRRWRDQCLEWCYDRVDGDRYADQKYLDEWPRLYGPDLVVLQHPGAGLAPWNWESGQLVLREGTMTAHEMPLVFYHFHGVKILSSLFISNGLADWGLMPYRKLRWFYATYFRQICATREWLSAHTGKRLPLKDHIIRGNGIGLASVGEILRKAWAQIMFVPSFSQLRRTITDKRSPTER